MADEGDGKSIRSMDAFCGSLKTSLPRLAFRQSLTLLKLRLLHSYSEDSVEDWLQHEILIIIILEANKKLHNFCLEIILFNSHAKAPPTKRNEKGYGD